MSCGVGRRWGSDLALLCLWRRPAAAAPIPPLAWELPHAMGTALKRQQQQHKELLGVPVVAQWLTNPGLAQWVKDPALL